MHRKKSSYISTTAKQKKYKDGIKEWKLKRIISNDEGMKIGIYTKMINGVLSIRWKIDV